MFKEEAVRLREIILAQRAASPLLNLGSSTRHFRELVKPHIRAELFEPLGRAGIEIFHSDLKQADGVDLAGDILAPDIRRALRGRGFRMLLIANMLEHVADRAAVAAACEEIVWPSGLILATVPSSFPYHADPIDTGFRPTPEELAALFTGSRPLLAEEVIGRTYAEDMAARGSSLALEIGRTLLGLLLAPVRPKSFRAKMDRWRWYSRPYRVSLALVEVSAPSSGG